jgi:response regulator RpfG family c-di-GMP phosphodiesterase/tRNA A-37 threonylcarbamoyl transferase component Bud32
MARVGKYVVTGDLARSGRVFVHSALDPVIGRSVAVKVIHKDALDPAEEKAILQRFQREAQAAGKLSHTNIVAIYEYGEDATQAWLAMELLPGKSLREHLASGTRSGHDQLPGIAAQMLEALDHAHGRGVTHRGLKPANVLISEAGEAKVGDFGLARADRANDAYTAPEQLEGRVPDERADIYSAAVIIHELVSGALPTGGAAASLPAPVREAFGKALAKDPRERYASAREFLEALRAAMKPRLALNAGALRRAVRTASPDDTALSKVRKRPSILCVDDEERVLNALAGLLEPAFEVETATSAAAGLERMKARRFLVVVSDQRMPGMTGVEFLREAKALAPATVRLLLTGYSDLAAIVGSVNDSEVFRFVSKPWQQEELRATLDEAVSVAIALEAAAARGGTPAATLSPVLIIGDAALARGAREISRSSYPVIEAANQVEALEVLARTEIGAVVCDLDRPGEDPGALLRALKAQAPRTQLVAISASADSELVIGLINEARIHRFMAKPVNLSLLGQALESALARHAAQSTSPELARSENASKGRDTAQVRSLLEKMKSLGGRFARALGV